MTLVWLGITVWAAAGILTIVGLMVAAWRNKDKPLTDYDRRCAAIDRELDELWARRNTRPHGNCQIVPFPVRPRECPRGDAS